MITMLLIIRVDNIKISLAKQGRYVIMLLGCEMFHSLGGDVSNITTAPTLTGLCPVK